MPTMLYVYYKILSYFLCCLLFLLRTFGLVHRKYIHYFFMTMVHKSECWNIFLLFCDKNQNKKSRKMIITYASTGTSKPSDSLASNSQNKHQEESPVSRNSESKHFHSSLHYSFPKKRIGGQNLWCQHQWLKDFPWLHYDGMIQFL